MSNKKRLHWKRPRLTHEEILELFDAGIYKADLEEGVISNGKGPLKIKRGGRESEYPFVRLYYKERIVWIPVSHVIWIVGNRRAIPDGFEVHHKDFDCDHNWFDNLFCLSEPDHRKLHRVGSLIDETEETPF